MDDDKEEYVPPVSADSVFDDALSSAASNFDNSLKAKFSETEYKKIRTIGAFLMRGLSLNESCVLARVSQDKLAEVMDANEDVRSFIIFKQIAYKAELLSTLSASAMGGKQAKSAGYLLEKKFPSEFNPRIGGPEVRTPDVVERAIAYVRENSGVYLLKP